MNHVLVVRVRNTNAVVDKINKKGGKMTTRIIVWTIVGLLVLAFVIFLLPQIREGKRLEQSQKLYSKEHIISDEQAYQDYIARCERDVSKFAKQIEQRKARLTNPTPAQADLLNQLDEKYNEFTKIVSELKEKTTREDRDAAFTTLRELKSDMRKMIRQLGGRTATASGKEEGGE